MKLKPKPKSKKPTRKNDKTIKVKAPKLTKWEDGEWEVVRGHDAETIAFLAQQIVDNGEKYKTLHEQYVDSLAVIRYLETKLFVLIQHTKDDDA
jgi:hypothetical protein